MNDPRLDPPTDDLLDRLLAAEPPYPLPEGLVARVRADLPSAAALIHAPSWAPAWGKVAAAVLLVVGSWFWATGALPTEALADPAPVLREAIAPTVAWLAPVDVTALGAGPARDAEPWGLALLGGLALSGGLLLGARLLHRRSLR